MRDRPGALSWRRPPYSALGRLVVSGLGIVSLVDDVGAMVHVKVVEHFAPRSLD